MISMDFKQRLADILYEKASIHYSDLVKLFFDDSQEEKSRIEDRLIANLATFNFWGMIETDKFAKERLVCLTPSGREQIEKVRELKKNGGL